MPRRILIVDDQEDMLLIMEREFRRMEGVVLTTASKVADALALVASEEIDLVISDVRIGKDSGFDLARDIKRNHPAIGTILMSAYRSASNRQQAADLGVLLFLEKPFQFPKLKEAIESFFQPLEQPAPAPVAEPAPPVAPAAMQATGSLAHFRLQDLVQLFCLNGKNIRITVGWENKTPAGEIHIQRGRVIHADFEGTTGEQAFYALMLIIHPILRVNDWAAPVPVTISTGWEHLLLQSAIQTDQRDASGEDPQIADEDTNWPAAAN